MEENKEEQVLLLLPTLVVTIIVNRISRPAEVVEVAKGQGVVILPISIVVVVKVVVRVVVLKLVVKLAVKEVVVKVAVERRSIPVGNKVDSSRLVVLLPWSYFKIK